MASRYLEDLDGGRCLRSIADLLFGLGLLSGEKVFLLPPDELLALEVAATGWAANVH